MFKTNTLDPLDFQINFDQFNIDDIICMPDSPFLINWYMDSQLLNMLEEGNDFQSSCYAYFLAWLLLLPDIILNTILNVLEIASLFIYLGLDLIDNMGTLMQLFFVYRKDILNPKKIPKLISYFEQEKNTKEREQAEKLYMLYLILIDHFDKMYIYECIRSLIIKPTLSILSILLRILLLPIKVLYCVNEIMSYYENFPDNNNKPAYKSQFFRNNPNIDQYIEYFNHFNLDGFDRIDALSSQYLNMESQLLTP